MTISPLESAHDTLRQCAPPRHPLEAAELTLHRTFYPLGFPTEVSTNSPMILSLFEEGWGESERRFDTVPIHVQVHVNEHDEEGCPPSPAYSIMRPLMVSIADVNNFSVADLDRTTTQIHMSRNAERQIQFARYFFLDAGALLHIATHHATPIHAACVELGGKGVLLCGDSGAGKSTLAFACAREGWTYVTDDAAYLVHGTGPHLVTGNCRQVRFRPHARQLFPEIGDRQITPRAEGKPSIEVPTDTISAIRRSQTAEVDFIVFLNRSSGRPPGLVPYSKSAARSSLRETLFNWGDRLEQQYQSIERLLDLDVFELQYTSLDWAVERLRVLVTEGR